MSGRQRLANLAVSLSAKLVNAGADPLRYLPLLFRAAVFTFGYLACLSFKQLLRFVSLAVIDNLNITHCDPSVNLWGNYFTKKS